MYFVYSSRIVLVSVYVCRGGSSLDAFTVNFSLFTKKNPQKDLGPGVYSLRGRKRVNEQEGK